MSVTPETDKLRAIPNGDTYDLAVGQRWAAISLAAQLEERNADLLEALEACARHGLQQDAELRAVRVRHNQDVDDLAELVSMLSSKLKSAATRLLILSGCFVALLIIQLWRFF